MTTTSSSRHRTVDTPAGHYLIAAGTTDAGDAITGIWREGQLHFPAAERLGTPASGADPLLEDATSQLLSYLDGTTDTFDLPLRPHGTEFQHRVWSLLQEIPRGSTTTYGRLARRLERPRAAQAVGRAVGANPISIVIPCHRVLGADGGLTGYAGGTSTKAFLLHLEGVGVTEG